LGDRETEFKKRGRNGREKGWKVQGRQKERKDRKGKEYDAERKRMGCVKEMNVMRNGK
jgi:hypothetical protein